jgi:hypothetical protein
MEIETFKGLVIFTGIVTMYAFVIAGCMERRLKYMDRVIRRIEEDAKYVN